ncbi:hypothetical protein [Bartonella sp. CL1QHWL]|uniref:hypothetical protein n=1 Tax=Bartonella sp. CL1QHWL TaxID=3243517 RepID=UPI0035D08B1A
MDDIPAKVQARDSPVAVPRPAKSEDTPPRRVTRRTALLETQERSPSPKKIPPKRAPLKKISEKRAPPKKAPPKKPPTKRPSRKRTPPPKKEKPAEKVTTSTERNEER